MERKSNKGLIIIIVILSLLLVGVSGYLVYDKVFSKDEVKEEALRDEAEIDVIEENEAKEDIPEISEEISLESLKDYGNVYSIVYNSIINNKYTAHAGANRDYFYRNDSINITNMDYNVLMSMVMEQYGNTSENSISSLKLEKIFKEIFGDQIGYQTNNFQYGLLEYRYDSANNSYIKIVKEGGNATGSSRENNIVKVLKTNNFISVYDVITISSLNETGEVDSYKKQYKYVFKLNVDGNYYFYGVELVK